jgi:hypothetical protein
MENFVGLLYNSGATQEGVGYKNGFGSVYAISGFSTAYTPTSSYDQSQINIVGINERILETEGFIFWTKFKIDSTIGSGFQYFSSYGQYFGPSPSGFNFSIGNLCMTFGLCNTLTSVPAFFVRHSLNNNTINSSSDKTSSFNVLIYKEPSKNFNRDLLIKQLYFKYGIQCIVQFYPLYKYPLFKNKGFGYAHCPQTEKFFNNMISFPFYIWMTKKNFNYMVESVKNAINDLTKKN